MGETGETRETGENFDSFRHRMPAFNGTELKFSNMRSRSWWADRLVDDRTRMAR